MQESGTGMTVRTRQTWLRTLLVGLIGAGVASLYPSTSTVCPAWTIQVVDTAGSPLRGAFVRQVWKDYSVDSARHQQDVHTDENGHVSFPERTLQPSPPAPTPRPTPHPLPPTLPPRHRPSPPLPPLR